MSLSLGIVTGSMSRNAGGLFNSVRKSAIHLSAAGADVSVYALEDEHSEADTAEWGPLRPHVLPRQLRGLLPFSNRLGTMLAAGDHDVIHLHGIWQLQSRSVNLWKRKTGRPVMVSPRGMLDSWALENSAWKKKLAGVAFENRNLREADCLHALNDGEATSMRAHGLANPIAVIPNATDLPDITPRQRQAEEQRTLLYLGRIHPKKGLTQLLSAWAKAVRESPRLARDWRLRIAGWDDGGHVPALAKQVVELDIGASVEIVGPSFGEEKDALLRSVDAFILPSFSEGLPMSVLEAWAYRLPVLMTAACNLPEGFQQSAAIEIVTDPERLARSLVETLRRADLERIGDCGRRLVEKHFGWTSIVERHLAVYEWMLGRGAAPGCIRFAAL